MYIYKIAFFVITFFSFLLWYSCFTTLHSFLLYIEVNWLYRYIHPLFFGFPSHLGLRRALGRAPCAIQQVLNQFSPVAQSCPTLCNSMDYSLPGSLLCPWNLAGHSPWDHKELDRTERLTYPPPCPTHTHEINN